MSTKSIPTLTLDGARIALAAAEQRSKEINVPMNIAIMDNACHLLAFARMEGAKLTSINIAIDKAFTAAGHRAPTSVYKDNVTGLPSQDEDVAKKGVEAVEKSFGLKAKL
ncbi:unnamed protein product [Alternaria sp. RS040]